MDPIRPIGPIERDLEPVVRVTRPSPDGRRERHDPRGGARREQPSDGSSAAEQDAELPPRDDEAGPSLIDVRV